MKQGQLLNKIVIIGFTVAILLVFGVTAWSAAHPSYYTSICYEYTVQNLQSTEAIIAREEVVLTAAVGTVALIPDEGTRVAVGQTVAAIYADDAAVAYMDTLEELETEYALLSQAREGTTKESVTIRSELGQAMVALQQTVTSGQLTQLEDEIHEIKSLVYQWEYAHGDASSAQEIDTSLAVLESQIAANQGSQSTQISQVSTSYAGTFSSRVDGYESVLTPAMLEDITPSALEGLLNGTGITVSDPTPVGKIITNSTWYLICALDESQADSLVVGEDVSVYFAQGWNETIDMEIYSVSSSEDGQKVVILATDRYLADTTLLRCQEVEIIFEELSGIYIPEEALRVTTVQSYNSETELWEDTTVTGVYVQVAEVAEFKQVNVLKSGDGYYLVTSAKTDTSNVLNAGAELIISNQDIYDGKVMSS